MDVFVSSDSDVLAVFCGVFVTTAGDVGCSLLRPTGLDPPPLASLKSAISGGGEVWSFSSPTRGKGSMMGAD